MLACTDLGVLSSHQLGSLGRPSRGELMERIWACEVYLFLAKFSYGFEMNIYVRIVGTLFPSCLSSMLKKMTWDN